MTAPPAMTAPDVVRPAAGKGVATKVVERFRGGGARRVEHRRNGDLVDVTHLYRSGKTQHVMAYGPGDETARVTTYFESGTPNRSFTLVKGVPDGELVTYDEEGLRRSVMPYAKGKPNGLEKRFDANGRLAATSVWENGLREGPFTTWYPTAPPERETVIQYTAGVPASKGSAWHRSGNLKAMFSLISGLKHGEELRYADNDKRQIDAIFRYQYGLLHGRAETFWEPNRKRTDVNYVGGKAVGLERHWHFNGKKAFEVQRVRGERQGAARMWDEKGVLVAILQYRAGVLHGNEFRFYRESGAVRAVFVWQDGKLQGTARVWRDAGVVNKYGTLLAMLPLQNGQIHGTEVRFHEDGKTMWMEVARQHGVVDGDVKVYRKDGTRERVMGYVAGKQHGRTLIFDMKGDKVIGEYHFTEDKPSGMARRWYVGGAPRQEWPWAETGAGVERQWHAPTKGHATGELQWTVPIVAGKRQGVQTVYAEQGWKWAERSWNAGEMTGEERRFYKSGRLMGVYPLVDGKWQGKAKIYAKRGGWLWSEQPYDNHQLHGTETRFARNGSRFALYTWQHGVLKSRRYLQRRGGGKRLKNGCVVFYYAGTENLRRESCPTIDKNVKLEVEYYPNGAKRVEAPLRGGKRHGEATFYRDDGRLHARVTFADGQRSGSEVRYFATGEKQLEIPFKDDKPVGYVRSYFRDGTVQSRYPAGQLPTGTEIQYHRNGAVRMTVPMVKGERDGYARVQGPYGRSVVRLSYRKGERHGLEVHYHPNGKPRMVVPVNHGQRTGRAVIYTSAGQRWAEVPYQAGSRHGTERRFGPSGDHVIEERDYRNDVPVERRSYITTLRGPEPPPAPAPR